MHQLTEQDISRVIEMAWEDRTPFEAIAYNFDITEPQLVRLMRNQLSLRAFKRWRQRHRGRKTKHLSLRDKSVNRSHCATQYKHK
ncbi:TIGR03643 family protein [Motilimonas pumila]|uniref:TIGR03643 family protein n=1 Tax=Motilimonas pumila TaxID=2303987 RepID=A0A418YFQ7_9GAMM|nr:TIGR03643 family protein [Motilimonas pumila]RJG48151.1 TIGR03643 family protein [Motilimonas pumila]